MAETTTPATARVIDEHYIREVFARFNDRAAFFADTEGTWVDRPHYRVIPEDLVMNTREEILAWFSAFFDAIPDLHMEVEDVAIAGAAGRERVTVRWHIGGSFTGGPLLGIEPTG
jgi:hypothetical protein